MAKIPIKYAEQLPPAQGPNVRANIDTNTGETALWNAVANLGGTAANIGLDILDRAKTAENAGLVSEGRRKIKERLLLAQRESEAEADQDIAYATLTTGFASAESVADEYKSPEVRGALSGFFNEVSPGMRESVVRNRVAIEQKNAAFAAEADVQQALGDGRTIDAAEALGRLAIVYPEKREEIARRVASVPIDSAIAQYGVAVANGRTGAAEELKAGLKGVELSKEQAALKRHYDGLLDQTIQVIESQSIEDTHQNIVEFDTEYRKGKTLPTERNDFFEAQRAAIRVDPALSGKTRKLLIDMLDSEQSGKGAQIDPDAIIENEQAVQSISADSSPQERQAAHDIIMANARRAGGTNTAKYLGELNTRLEKAAADLVSGSINDAVADGHVTTSQTTAYRRTLESRRRQKPDESIRDFRVWAAGTAIDWETERPGAPTTIGQVAGAVASGGIYDPIVGIWTFDNADMALKYVMNKVGPDWGRYPEIVKQMKEKWGIEPGTAITTQPSEYPDSVWSEEHGMWTVERNGRLKGVK